MSNKAIPKLAELHLSPEEAFKNDELNYLLNQPPHKDWIKKHPHIKVKDITGRWVQLEYLPVDKIEYLLIRIFQKIKIEVISYSHLANSAAVHVRLWYKHPVDGEWMFHDGLGAVVLQFDAAEEVNGVKQKKDRRDVNNMKDAAVQIGLPAAKSFAVKDAAECLGKLFGKDLNRIGTIEEFVGSYNAEAPTPPPQPAAPATGAAAAGNTDDDFPL